MKIKVDCDCLNGYYHNSECYACKGKGWFKVEVESEYPPCKLCGGPNDMAELCASCGEDNDPYFECDNSGKDLK